MKHLWTILLPVLYFLTGCAEVAEVEQYLELRGSLKTEIELESKGDQVNVRFDSSHEWTVEMTDGSSWLEATPLSGEPGTGRIKVSADANTTGQLREGGIIIRSQAGEIAIKFSQGNHVPMFELQETEGRIDACGGLVVIPINTNLEFTYECPEDWMIPVTTNLRKAKEVVIAVKPNIDAQSRAAEVVFRSEGAEYVFGLTQEAADSQLLAWENMSFARRSLAMRFTATWCGYCPMMGTAFDSAKEQMNGALELLSLHGSESDYEFSGTNELQRRFAVDGFPTGIIDSRASIPNYSYTSTTAKAAVMVAEETQKYYPVSAGISCSSHLSGKDLSVCLSLYFKEDGSYRVTVLLLEDGIVGFQNGGGNSYKHNDVARVALTSMSGDPVRVAAGNTISTMAYNISIGTYNPDNLKVLVYVEKAYGDQAKAEEVNEALYGNYGDTYIDNCRAVKLGETAALELR